MTPFKLRKLVETIRRRNREDSQDVQT
jgi:hypothetical protein